MYYSNLFLVPILCAVILGRTHCFYPLNSIIKLAQYLLSNCIGFDGVTTTVNYATQINNVNDRNLWHSLWHLSDLQPGLLEEKWKYNCGQLAWEYHYDGWFVLIRST